MSAVRNLIIHKYLAVAPAFQFLKVSVGHKIENMSVSQKIEIVSVSQKIVIYRVLLRRADRGGRTMGCNGPNWCLADCMLRNYYQTLSKTAKTCVNEYFVTDRHFYKE